MGQEFPVLEVVLSKKQQADNTQMSPFHLLLVSGKCIQISGDRKDSKDTSLIMETLGTLLNSYKKYFIHIFPFCFCSSFYEYIFVHRLLLI